MTARIVVIDDDRAILGMLDTLLVRYAGGNAIPNLGPVRYRRLPCHATSVIPQGILQSPHFTFLRG